MLKSLSRAYCAPASSPPARKHAEPPAKWHALAERRRPQRRAAYPPGRRGVSRRTNAGGRRR